MLSLVSAVSCFLVVLLSLLLSQAVLQPGHMNMPEKNYIAKKTTKLSLWDLNHNKTKDLANANQQFHPKIRALQPRENDSDDSGSTLVLIQVIHRHGDRSPEHSFPKDPYLNSWPQGLGQLSKLGMQQGFDLGLFLQEKYTKFLGSKLNPKQICVTSSDYDRTLMTAECVVVGLLPPIAISNVSNSSHHFQPFLPVPIHTVPVKTDKLLRPSHSCKFIKELRANNADSQASNRQENFKKEDWLYLSQVTGMVMNSSSLQDLADIIFCQKMNNMTQPAWLTKDIEDKILDYKFKKEYVSPEKAKYLVGTLFATLNKNMKKIMNNSPGLHKIILFSAHESNIRFLKALLGNDSQMEVPYIGAIIVELHKRQEDYYVRFLYRNNSDQQPQVLLLNHCTPMEFCTYTTFEKGYNNLIFTDDDWDDFCQTKSWDELALENNIIPVIVGVLVVLLAVIMFLSYKLYHLSHQVKQKLCKDQYTLLENNTAVSDSDNEIELEDMFSIEESLEVEMSSKVHNNKD